MTSEPSKKKPRFKSLANTLLLTFLTLCLSMIFGSNALQIYTGFRVEEQLIISQQQQIAANAGQVVSGFVEKRLQHLMSAAELRNLANADPKEQEITLNKILGGEPSFRQIIIADTNGFHVSKVSRMSSFASEKFSSFIDNNIIQKFKDKDAYVSSVYIDDSTSEPMVLLSVPIKNIFGDTTMSLSAELNLKFIWDLVSQIKVGQKGVAYVVDHEGNLLAFKDTSQVLKGQNLRGIEEVAEFIRNEGDSDTNMTQHITRGIQGTRVVSTYFPLGTPDWAVVIETPLSEAYSAVIQQAIYSALIIFLSVLLVVTVSIYASRKITLPIMKLRDGVLEISGGNLNVKVDVESKNELGEVAEAFNAMSSQIRQYYSELETKVKLRTEELDKKVAEVERMNKLMVGRELKMVELKKEIEELKKPK